MTQPTATERADASAPKRRPTQAESQARTKRRVAIKREIVPWLFLLPGLILALTFKFYPAFDGAVMSLMKVRPYLGDIFVGLDNYVAVLTDQRFINSIGHTLFLAVVQTVGALILGFGLALLLEGQARTLWFVRSAVFLPVVTAVAVVGELWRIMYYPTEAGFINSILGTFGIPVQPFLSDPSTALVSISIMGIWGGAPYNMIIIVAGLAGIDRALYESAGIDGASTWHRLLYIVLPALRPSIAVVLTLAAIRGLRAFTEVYVLTGGGPAGSTEVWMTRTFSIGFADTDNLGVASAASMLLLVVTLILTIGVRLATSRRTDQ